MQRVKVKACGHEPAFEGEFLGVHEYRDGDYGSPHALIKRFDDGKIVTTDPTNVIEIDEALHLIQKFENNNTFRGVVSALFNIIEGTEIKQWELRDAVTLAYQQFTTIKAQDEAVH